MPVRFVNSRPEVAENIGKTSVTRGPLVYCAEEIDNNFPTQQLSLKDMQESQAVITPIEEGIMQGIYQIQLPSVKLIPYYSWCNRGDNRTMSVWIGNE